MRRRGRRGGDELNGCDRTAVQGRPADRHAEGERGNSDDGSGPNGEAAGQYGQLRREVTKCVRPSARDPGGDGCGVHASQRVRAQPGRRRKEHGRSTEERLRVDELAAVLVAVDARLDVARNTLPHRGW